MLDLLLGSQGAPEQEDHRSTLLNQEVVIVKDVEPDKPGQARATGGVYWRCRTTSSTPIRAGQRAYVHEQNLTTLWVLPT